MAKKVEVDVDRNDINDADLKVGKNTKGQKPNRRNRRNDKRNSDSRGNTRGRRNGQHASKKNDTSWHKGSDQLAKDAASFAQQYPMGVKLPAGYNGVVSSMEFMKPNDMYMSQDPAILSIDFIPTVGLPMDSQAPINQAARLQYSFVRYANSGSPVGSPSHLMRFYVAADSLFVFHQFGVRAYGLLNLVNYANQYLPRIAVEAAGFDYDDLIANSAQFRYTLNMFAMKLRRITVPNNMAYQKRHMWMVQGIYTDSESPRAQMYVFRPSAVYQYVEAEKERLIYKEIKERLTVAEYTDIMNQLLAAVLESESFGVTTADILKAYGGENLLILPEISDIYSVLPVYSEEVMSIVENATIWNLKGFDYLSALEVIDDTEPLSDNWMKVQRNFFQYSYTSPGKSYINQEFMRKLPLIASGLSDGWMVNLHKMVTPDEMITYTSLTNPAKFISNVVVNSESPVQTANFGIYPDVLRAELLTNARIYYGAKTRSGMTSPEKFSVLTMEWITPLMMDITFGVQNNVTKLFEDNPLSPPGMNQMIKFRYLLDNFDWNPACPAQYLVLQLDQDQGTVRITRSDYFGDGRDTEDFTLLTREDLARMAELDLISLFDAPEIAIMSSKPYHKA